MKAITIRPSRPDSLRLEEVPEPRPDHDAVLVRAIAAGVCGTDYELIAGHYGKPPPGRERLVIGHESLGAVVEAPARCGLEAGDTVVGIVRRPDPAPCASCAAGEWDMCRNGRYTERGIKEIDGYCAEQFLLEPIFAVRVDPGLGICSVLVEPASVVAKAWEHTERIGRRSRWTPQRVLITGAGPVGLLAALFATQRGLEVHVLDRNRSGPKPDLVRALGAQYHTCSLREVGFEPDVLMECTGAAPLIVDALCRTAHGAVVCLAGLSSGRHEVGIDIDALNRALVLENDVVFGSVSANRRHYEDAADALARADRGWLERIIARRVPLERWAEAFERREHDIKTIIDFT